MAALAGLLQERVLKAKKRSALTRLLPSVADADNLLFKMLTLEKSYSASGLPRAWRSTIRKPDRY